MEFLENAIRKKGKVLSGNVLKVNSFLNGEVDTAIMSEIGDAIFAHFKGKTVTKVLTAATSGIAIAATTAPKFNCNYVIAKKTRSLNMTGEIYCASSFSFTNKSEDNLIVPKELIGKDDKILIVDDFMAEGKSGRALLDIVKQSGAELVGFAVAIEKGFQGAGDKMRAEGIDLFSCVIIDKMDDDGIEFRK